MGGRGTGEGTARTSTWVDSRVKYLRRLNHETHTVVSHGLQGYATKYGHSETILILYRIDIM